jgi:hypothetical protein
MPTGVITATKTREVRNRGIGEVDFVDRVGRIGLRPNVDNAAGWEQIPDYRFRHAGLWRGRRGGIRLP